MKVVDAMNMRAARLDTSANVTYMFHNNDGGCILYSTHSFFFQVLIFTKSTNRKKMYIPYNMWWKKYRRTRSRVSTDGNSVQICFHTGDMVILKLEDVQKELRRVNVDDELQRAAYDMSALVETKHLPRSFICPITRMPLNDPVMCADGYSYERVEITRWMKKKPISPYTGARLAHNFITPNHTLRNAISEVMENKHDDEETMPDAE